MYSYLLLNFFITSLLFILITFCNVSFGNTEHHTRSWNMAIITGSLTKNSEIKYYLQPQLNFIDDKYKFNNAFLYAGIGYQSAPNVILWLMNGFVYTKKLNGSLARTDIIRQQINWNFTKMDNLQMSSTSRMEERKRFSEAEWSLRLRENLQLRYSIPHWEKHSLVLFDEIFLSLNTPKWINSHTFVQQNRAFIGIGTEISKQVAFDLGYLNQYEFKKNSNEMNNVLNFILNVTFV